MGSDRGLTTEEARRRLALHGPNEIQRQAVVSSWIVLARQFNSPVIWLLMGACVVSVGLGEAADAMAIVAIVILNGVIGFAQERRAERAILALRSMTAPRARVFSVWLPMIHLTYCYLFPTSSLATNNSRISPASPQHSLMQSLQYIFRQFIQILLRSSNAPQHRILINCKPNQHLINQ